MGEGNVSLTLISGVLQYYHLFLPTSKQLPQKCEQVFVSRKLGARFYFKKNMFFCLSYHIHQ